MASGAAKIKNVGKETLPLMEKTTTMEIVLSQHVNGMRRLFGGVLMSWIDVLGGVTARRWCHTDVTTAAVDYLEFLAPAYMGDTIILEGVVTWTGHTSMEVRVETFVEHLEGDRTMINRAYLVYVAMDGLERPTAVPPMTPETPEEQAEWEAALLRKQQRTEKRQKIRETQNAQQS